MTDKIQLKRSSVAGKTPTLESLDWGELAVNTTDSKVFFKSGTSGSETLTELTQEKLTKSGSLTNQSTIDKKGILATDLSTVSGDNTSIISSRGCKITGNISAIIASGDGSAVDDTNSQVTANRAIVAASNISKAGGTQSLVAASYAGETGAINSAVLASHSSKVNHQRSVVIGSYGVLSAAEHTITGGWVSGTGQITPSTANRKWQIDGSNGNVSIAGSLSSSATFSDYAEYFENETGLAIPLGTIVTLSNSKVRSAIEGEPVLGVVSATAGIILGDTEFTWQNRYLKGEFGEILTQPMDYIRYYIGDELIDVPFIDADLPDHTDYEIYQKMLPIDNPDYDPSLIQIPRSQRPDEWTPVALMGQVYVRVTNFVEPNDFVKPTTTAGKGGKSATKTNLRCMKITTPYDSEKGYAVALCALKGGF